MKRKLEILTKKQFFRIELIMEHFHVPGPKNSKSMWGTMPYLSFLFGLMKLYLLHTADYLEFSLNINRILHAKYIINSLWIQNGFFLIKSNLY